MGLTYVGGKVQRLDRRGVGVRVRFLVDSGALYTVLPERVWKALRLVPSRSADFVLADGTEIERGVADCCLEIGSRRAVGPSCSAPAPTSPSSAQ